MTPDRMFNKDIPRSGLYIVGDGSHSKCCAETE
jgi:hypothetical protein